MSRVGAATKYSPTPPTPKDTVGRADAMASRFAIQNVSDQARSAGCTTTPAARHRDACSIHCAFENHAVLDAVGPASSSHMCLAAPSPTNTTRASRAANMMDAARTSKPGDFRAAPRTRHSRTTPRSPLASGRSQFTGQLAFDNEHSTGHAARSTLP